MKKYLVVLCGLYLLALVTSASGAGLVNIYGRGGLYSPGAGANASLLYGIAADYDITEHLLARAALETTTYVSGGQQVTYMPATLDIIYRRNLFEFFYPYAGLGVSYNSTARSGGSTTFSTGAQAEAGIEFNLRLFEAGIEYRYLVSDITNPTQGRSSYSGYLTGSVFRSFYF